MTRTLKDWNNNSIGIVPYKCENPMLIYGYGPEGAECRDCVHFLRVRHHDATYRKCDLRTLTHGKGSDHKASWPACKRFVRGAQETRYTDE
jgi:hypothetical protein